TPATPAMPPIGSDLKQGTDYAMPVRSTKHFPASSRTRWPCRAGGQQQHKLLRHHEKSAYGEVDMPVRGSARPSEPAARLAAIKADIARHLGRPGLSVAAAAARQAVTARYVQMLFEAEGTTFSKYVLGQRLARAHALLIDPRRADSSIKEIA